MDLAKLPSILWRWRWAVISVIVVAGVALALHLRTTTTAYQSRVRIQVTAPQDADVSLIDTGNPSSSTLRDDLTLVQNDFLAVVNSDEVRRRTSQQLGLNG